MDSLYAYLDLINARLLSYTGGTVGHFIRLLQEERFLSEDVLKQRICGDKFDKQYYYALKSKVLYTLQTFALMNPPRGSNEVMKKLTLCRKNFLLGQTFLGKGEIPEGIRLIKQAHKIATTYQFTMLSCETSNILYHHYVHYNRKRSLADLYRSQTKTYLADYVAEKHAEDLYFDQVGNQVSRNQASTLKQALIELRRHQRKSIRYLFYVGTLEVMYGYNIGKYSVIIKTCKRMIAFFKEQKGVYSSYYQFFFINQAIAHMAMSQYTKAGRYLNQADTYSPRHSHNDYMVRLYRTINALHSGQYALAYDLYKKGTRCKYKPIREQFGIIEAYLCFLSCNGFFTLDKGFRISKYLNETFRAQADKKGDNIAIIIAELLVYLVRNRGKFIDRIEAVSNYTYRHLREPEHQRAKRFIQILTLLPRANFNAVAINRIAHRHITYIQDHPIRMGQNVFLEIIPFERLLDMLQYHLHQKRA